jgi:hypothetical protein
MIIIRRRKSEEEKLVRYLKRGLQGGALDTEWCGLVGAID